MWANSKRGVTVYKSRRAGKKPQAITTMYTVFIDCMQFKNEYTCNVFVF